MRWRARENAAVEVEDGWLGACGFSRPFMAVGRRRRLGPTFTSGRAAPERFLPQTPPTPDRLSGRGWEAGSVAATGRPVLKHGPITASRRTGVNARRRGGPWLNGGFRVEGIAPRGARSGDRAPTRLPRGGHGRETVPQQGAQQAGGRSGDRAPTSRPGVNGGNRRRTGRTGRGAIADGTRGRSGSRGAWATWPGARHAAQGRRSPRE